MRTKSFAELLSGYTTAVQASASGLVDFTVGSILRACGESVSQVVLWLQGLILAQVALSRASTSTGADLDSWMADFGLTRLDAVKATGSVTFSRFSTTAAGLVPTGTTVETTDGSQEFSVITDTGNAAWNTGLGGYVLAIGVGSVTVPVKASKKGAAGNVVAGAVTKITSTAAGIDTVVNAAVFSGGSDIESDAAFRLRFQLFINSLSRATVAAVKNATAQTTGVTSYTVTENEDPDGTPHDGFFYVVIDDGSGNPANSLVNAVTAAVEEVRPVGTTFDVIKPTLLTANVAFKIAPVAGFTNSAMQTKAAAAVTAYINSLELGEALPFTRIAQVAYDASEGIANVFNVTVNTATADLAGSPKQVIRAGTVTVTH